MALTTTTRRRIVPRARSCGINPFHHHMKSLITILLLLFAVAPLHAGWFFKDPPPPPDLGPEYRANIKRG